MSNEKRWMSKILGIVKNHMQRAQEGRTLLEQGRTLSEMQTAPIGLTPGETVTRRQQYLDFIRELDDQKLAWVYKNVIFQLSRRYDDKDKGTSELEWQRIVFEDEFNNRHIDIPSLDIRI